MSDARRGPKQRETDAAAWFTRLSRRAVSTEDLRKFRAWRSRPENRAAYERVEAAWRGAGGLAGDPEILDLRERVGRRTAPRVRAQRRRIAWSAGAALAGLALVVLVVLTRPPSYESDVGEQRIVRLADGSTLRLNTDSRVVVRIGREARRVRLERGEALFEVAHDADRPFTVEAGRTSVRALGTVFDVRRRDGTVDVVLLQGSVEVRGPAGPPLRLRPNEKAVAPADAPPSAARIDARQATSWTERRLTFAHTPLAAAVAEVNRYSKARVELAAPDLAAAPVSGVFETGDAEAFAAAAASVFDLSITREGGRIVLRRPDDDAS